jgi:hypothetical protein
MCRLLAEHRGEFDQVFDAEDMQILGAAFDKAWEAALSGGTFSAFPPLLPFPFPPPRLLAPAELCARCLGPLPCHVHPLSVEPPSAVGFDNGARDFHPHRMSGLVQMTTTLPTTIVVSPPGPVHHHSPFHRVPPNWLAKR